MLGRDAPDETITKDMIMRQYVPIYSIAFQTFPYL
jgi:hypothetical protein